MTGHVLVVGASGVIGAAAVECFSRSAGWSVTALSRRAPIVQKDCGFTHLSVNLEDETATRQALAGAPPVTHLVYAAAVEAEDLAAGWRDEALIARNGRMFAHLLDPLAAMGALRHAVILQGVKAYGAHRHAIPVPAREQTPRDNHPNFYWLHEDHARARAAEAGFALTIFRPQVLLGSAPGVAMNPVLAFGAHAALCQEQGRPFTLPGSPDTMWEVVDTGLLAEAFGWAFDKPDVTDGETFNITNGDIWVPGHGWGPLAQALGLADGGPVEGSFAALFADPEAVAAWRRIAVRHGLRFPDLAVMLGRSGHYADLLLSRRIAAKPVPVLLSTIKIRQAGFAACRDSHASLLHSIGRMVALKILPPFPGGTLA